MHIPMTISRNAIEVYAPGRATRLGRLDGEDLVEWRKSLPNRLSEICLRLICDNFEENPILDELTLDQDRRCLLDNLSTDLPLSLAVPKIDDEIYWRRCYVARWPLRPPLPRPAERTGEAAIASSRRSSRSSVVSCGGAAAVTWKRCFLEMHFRETLENLRPEEYNSEQVRLLVDLCSGHIRKLRLDQTLAPSAGTACTSKDRIPLGTIIAGLPLLSELSICFKQMYVGEDFDWYVLQTTENDVRNLAGGLEKSDLTVLRIINSDVDGEKARVLLRGLLRNGNLRHLDLSYCKIGDKGAVAVAALILENHCLETAILANNLIGPEGAEVFSYVLSKPSGLKVLDLGLNTIGTQAANHLATALSAENCVLENLILTACGITSQDFKMADALARNVKLKRLDLSNNKLGEEFGVAMLQVLEVNAALRKLDLRMTGVTAATIFAIDDKMASPRTRGKGNLETAEMTFDEIEVRNKMETIFDGIEIENVIFAVEDEVEEEPEEILEEEEKQQDSVE